MSPELVGTIVSALAAAGATVYATWSSRRATRRTQEIEQQQTALGGYQSLVGDLRIEVDRLKSRVTELERGRHADQAYIRVLITTLRDHNVPVPVPER